MAGKQPRFGFFGGQVMVFWKVLAVSRFVIERYLSGTIPHMSPYGSLMRNNSAKVIVELSASRR